LFQSRAGFSARRDCQASHAPPPNSKFQSRAGFSARRDLPETGGFEVDQLGFNPVLGFLPVATFLSGCFCRHGLIGFNPVLGFLPVATLEWL